MNFERGYVQKQFLRDILDVILIAAFIFIFVRGFIVSPFLVNGDSMLPNFEHNNYLFVEHVEKRFGELKRGDVVVFCAPGQIEQTWLQEILNVCPTRHLIKRIVGLPGEHILINNDGVHITEPNDKKIFVDEGYILEDWVSYADIRLSKTEYFVMGDNRNASSDSRAWGPLEKTDIVGVPLLRMWPSLNLYPGAQTATENIVED